MARNDDQQGLSDRVYRLLFDEDEDRACLEIDEAECKAAPRNFSLNAANGAATKLAEQLASPDLTVPWMLSAIGAPILITGLLVPLRTTGSLLPQLAASGAIRRASVRKWVWVGAAAVQTAAVALMAVTVALLSGAAAGIAVVALITLFSIASGVESVSYQDVLAKTVPKGRRGRLLAVRSTIGGALTLGAGLVLYLFVAESETRVPYVVLLAAAAALFGASAILFARIAEQPGATAGGRNPFEELAAAWKLLRNDKTFVRFIGARALLLIVTLMQPFYVLLSRRLTGDTVGALGAFVIATGIGHMVGGPIWGKSADRAAGSTMVRGGLLAVIAAAYAVAFGLLPQELRRFYLYAPVFVLNAVAAAGVRLGRKTWLVDYAPAVERPLYVSLANTVLGVAMLAGGVFGVVAEYGSPEAAVISGGVLMLAGVALARTLPKTSASG